MVADLKRSVDHSLRHLQGTMLIGRRLIQLYKAPARTDNVGGQYVCQVRLLSAVPTSLHPHGAIMTCYVTESKDNSAGNAGDQKMSGATQSEQAHPFTASLRQTRGVQWFRVQISAQRQFS
jgi:hypothetical protein